MIRPPLVDLGLVESGERLRRLALTRPDVLALRGKILLHLRIGQRADHGGIDLGDDVGRRCLRRPQRVPIGHVQALRARLVDGRNVGREMPALRGHDRVGPDGAGANLRDRIGGLIEHDVDATRHQILHRRRAAAIGHKAEAGAGDFLKIHAGDLRAAGGADGAGLRLIGIGLEPSDKLAHVACREVLARDDQLRRVGNERDRRKIVRRVIGQIVGDRVDDLGASLTDQQGVAVRLGARDPGGADRTAGAADILDDDRLAERRLQGA
jgi:hypothetical protein